jgi:hypothetical protein
MSLLNCMLSTLKNMLNYFHMKVFSVVKKSLKFIEHVPH